MIRRLNWGCGPIAPFGWINADLCSAAGVDLVGDIRNGLPLSDNSIDYIVSIHALPEIHFADLERTVRELRRVLRPGGVLRLSLPDFDRAIRAYIANDVDYFFLIPDEAAKSLSSKLITQLLWYGRSQSLFTADFTKELLARAGFTQNSLCSFRETRSPFPGIVELDDRPLESLFIEATK
jgi:predicted SAM-dependent methyltransferase